MDSQSSTGIGQVARRLGSDAASALRGYTKRQTAARSRDSLVVDWQLASIVRERFRSEERKEFDAALSDPNCNKHFYDRTATMRALQAFAGPDVPSFRWNKNYQQSLSVVESLLIQACGGIQLTPMTLTPKSDVSDYFATPTASAGSIAPGSTKQDSAELIKRAALSIKADIRKADSTRKLDEIWFPALPFHRSQISGYLKNGKYSPSTLKRKARLVWCIDGATVVVEGQYAIPLMSKLADHLDQYAGGKNAYEQSRLIQSWRRQSAYWLSIDYSSYDASLPGWLIEDVFELIKRRFPSECGSEIEWIKRRFIHTDIIQFSGSDFTKHRGIPSGSFFTQAVGSLCNLVVILTYFIAHCGGLQPGLIEINGWRNGRIYPAHISCMAMGDDNIIFSRHKVDKQNLAQYVQRNFGLTVHPHKCEAGTKFEDPEFLKRYWRPDHKQSRNVLEMMINICHPEYERSYDGYTPWHILYGIYLTYQASMEKYWSEEYLVKQMRESRFGLSALKDVDTRDVPGSLRGAWFKTRRDLYERALNVSARLDMLESSA